MDALSATTRSRKDAITSAKFKLHMKRVGSYLRGNHFSMDKVAEPGHLKNIKKIESFDKIDNSTINETELYVTRPNLTFEFSPRQQFKTPELMKKVENYYRENHFSMDKLFDPGDLKGIQSFYNMDNLTNNETELYVKKSNSTFKTFPRQQSERSLSKSESLVTKFNSTTLVNEFPIKVPVSTSAILPERQLTTSPSTINTRPQNTSTWTSHTPSQQILNINSTPKIGMPSVYKGSLSKGPVWPGRAVYLAINRHVSNRSMPSVYRGSLSKGPVRPSQAAISRQSSNRSMPSVYKGSLSKGPVRPSQTDKIQ